MPTAALDALRAPSNPRSARAVAIMDIGGLVPRGIISFECIVIGSGKGEYRTCGGFRWKSGRLPDGLHIELFDENHEQYGFL